jgi:hypothetical protein
LLILDGIHENSVSPWIWNTYNFLQKVDIYHYTENTEDCLRLKSSDIAQAWKLFEAETDSTGMTIVVRIQ